MICDTGLAFFPTGTIPGERQEVREAAPPDGVSLDDFHALMTTHAYIFAPTREIWPAASVNARIPPVDLESADGSPKLNKNDEQVRLKANVWLDRNRPVEQMTWVPGEPMLIRDRLISDGGWIDRPGLTVFNFYRPPAIKPGNAEQATPWLDHVRKVYPDDAGHIIAWLAHRVQRPGEKINHALVLGGAQGIGKDTILEPAKQAIGPWNFAEVTPTQMLGRFNGFIKSVILRISEARDLGDVNRFAFYDRMKSFTAAPPDVLRCDEKHLREHSVPNVCGVILTTNHKSDGIHLPADDRRHYVAWSSTTKDDFTTGYWTQLWDWYAVEGNSHVAAYLADLDLSGFNAKAPPPKTNAFWEIVDANRAPENAELADILDRLGNPRAVTLEQITNIADEGLHAWLTDRKNRRTIPHRMEDVDYVPVRNPDREAGIWLVQNRRQVIYALKSLSLRDRIIAGRNLT